MLKKIERKLPLEIYLSTIHQIQKEMMNKSDLVNVHRNSVMSLDFKPHVNNSHSQHFERHSIFGENINISQLTGNNNLDQNAFINTNLNNSTMNATETKFVSNPNITASTTLINERSNSIFSTNSQKSIKVLGQMNPRISIIAKNTKRMSNIRKEHVKNFARFSLLLPEHTLDDKLEDIQDNEDSEVSSTHSFEENLDSSGEFTKMMKKDEKIPSKKGSIFSKNLLKNFGRTDSNRTNSIMKLDSLSLADIQRLKEAFNNNESLNDQGSMIIVTEKEENESSMEEQKYREQLLDYLKINNFMILYQKILNFEISPKQLLQLEDEKITEFIEEDHKDRIPNLKKFITDLDDAHDYDDLLKKIDSDILNCKFYIKFRRK